MKVVGWFFLSTAVLGCFVFISYIAQWRLFYKDDIFGWQINGGASNAPIMLGLMAIAGAYLLKDSDKRKSEGDDEHKNDPQ